MTGLRPPGLLLPDGLWAALGFLTVVPVPEGRAALGAPRATIYFPLVGMGLGALQAAVARLPIEPLIASVLAVALLFLLTGGLHWDGWADVVDATVVPAVSRDRRVAVLEDPRVGAHGAVGVALLAVAQVVALAGAPLWGVVLGSAFGRWCMVATLRWAPPLRNSGAAARLSTEARPLGSGVVVVALFVILAVRVAPAQVAVAVGTGALTAGALAVLLVGRLGGMNGDTHGATGLLAESVVWITTAHLSRGG